MLVLLSFTPDDVPLRRYETLSCIFEVIIFIFLLFYVPVTFFVILGSPISLWSLGLRKILIYTLYGLEIWKVPRPSFLLSSGNWKNST